MLENVRSQVLFKELERKSKCIETLRKRLVNGRAKEQAQISGLQTDLDKTEADLERANEAHKVDQETGAGSDAAIRWQCSKDDE
jgi:hypothetical protein